MGRPTSGQQITFGEKLTWASGAYSIFEIDVGRSQNHKVNATNRKR